MHPTRLLIIWLCLIATAAAPGAECRADETLAAIPVGDCTLSLEANPKWRTLRLRAHHPRHLTCRIEPESVRRALAEALAAPHPAWESGPFASLFIGRLVDYPWLARQLAENAAADRTGWDLRHGKPLKESINAYVAKRLFAAEGRRDFDPPLEGAGYRVAGITVEKVLVGSFAEVPDPASTGRKGKVPFDAQVWLRLENR